MWCFLTKVNENVKLNIHEQEKIGKYNQLCLGQIVSLEHLVIFYFNQPFSFLPESETPDLTLNMFI